MTLASGVMYLCLGILGYHFGGYLLLLYVWSKIRPKPINKAPIEPTVSILIAAYNEEALIAEKLDSCLALDYPEEKLEIIVVSDGSTDATDSIVSGYLDQQITFLQSPERSGKSHALNRSAEIASGDILLISDANAMLDPKAIRQLVANFADPTIGCASGSRHLFTANGTMRQSEGLYWKYESVIKRLESQTGSTMGVLGSMLAVRKEIFRPIPQNIINDDFFVVLCTLQQKQRVIYEPEARCHSYASQSFQQEKIRRRRISAGRFQHLINRFAWRQLTLVDQFKLISHKFLRLWLLILMTGALLFNIAAVWQSPSSILLLALLGAQATFYLLALYGTFNKEGRWLTRISFAAYYILNGAVASIEGIVGYLNGSETVLWHKTTRK